MEDAIEIGKLLHDTPDLFPWVCLAIILAIAYNQRKRIGAYFDARVESYKAKQQADAVMAELVRNNTAALNNNTAALESVKQDRGETRRMLDYHENASKERIEHLQTVMNRVDTTLTANNKMLNLLEDRTEGGR